MRSFLDKNYSENTAKLLQLFTLYVSTAMPLRQLIS